MIGKLKGTIEYSNDNYIVIDVNGVGYKVQLSPYTFGKIANQVSVDLFIHTHVREDILALYGFLTRDELEMFELLISVSGIGPKAGISILSIADPKTIKTAVINEDASILTKVSGVGKKTAERVILELKNKIAALPMHEKEQVAVDSDALEALTVLGYSNSQARDALKLVPKEITDVGERVKIALRSLGK